jgi:hypothetical protein
MGVDSIGLSTRRSLITSDSDAAKQPVAKVVWGSTCDLRVRRARLHLAASFFLPRLLAVFDNEAIAC